MRAFEHVDVASVEEAIDILHSEPDSKIIAGGTDLLVLMKDRLVNPRVLVNVKTIGGLDRLEADGVSGLVIGSLVTMARLGENPDVQSNFPVLAEAIRVAASPQLRNAATVGGNLCQRPRCWYYRGSFECFLLGGNGCLAGRPLGRNSGQVRHKSSVGADRNVRPRGGAGDASAARAGNAAHLGIFGRAECHAVNPSDLAPALVALGGSIVVQSAKGRKHIPLEDFFVEPRAGSLNQNVLGPAEMIVELRFPAQPEGARGIYLKAMERKIWSFAQASVAVQMWRPGDVVRDVRIVLGGSAPVPWRATVAEDMLRGQEPITELIEHVSNAAVEGARPFGGNGYKVALAKALVRRGLQTLLGTSIV